MSKQTIQISLIHFPILLYGSRIIPFYVNSDQGPVNLEAIQALGFIQFEPKSQQIYINFIQL